MLKLYHGSNVRIEKIDLSRGRVNKDFGKGFYLTSIRSQAEEMAKRKSKQYVGTYPIVTEFCFDDTILYSNELNIKHFTEVCAEWAEFILKNRKASRTGFRHDYDIVIGPIADDGVVQQLDLYEMNLISMSHLVEALRWRDLNDQYFFGTEKAISKLQAL